MMKFYATQETENSEYHSWQPELYDDGHSDLNHGRKPFFPTITQSLAEPGPTLPSPA